MKIILWLGLVKRLSYGYESPAFRIFLYFWQLGIITNFRYLGGPPQKILPKCS